eukprot:TRINITY_DN7315_c0_g1_i4.p1 TRINITY_DN7315_c0_g1~~TRINITY_DN7315_c0_g1_i4.p1  ORF type:complete len:128 (+),score=28.33 TRINITY_DN7315_c0_g1_i4:609-992(+)
MCCVLCLFIFRYLVSCNWCDHLLSGSSEPGPINNSGLLDEKGNLLPGLTMTEDFRIVNKETWNDLLQTFSIASSQEPISRTVSCSLPPLLLPFFPSSLPSLVVSHRDPELLLDLLWLAFFPSRVLIS